MLPVETAQNTDPREKNPDEITVTTSDSIDEGVDMEEPDMNEEEDQSSDSGLYDEE